MKKAQTTSTFNDGLMMDFNPIVTPNTALTGCLNGTLITYNGNENVLLNDMGNGRVETAFLPEGYVPLGTAELGGIVYIVSYNPNTNKCLIGSFPSPERNISSTEIYGESQENPKLIIANMIKDGEVISPQLKIIFSNIMLHPGDKFKIFGDSINSNKNRLSAYGNKEEIINADPRWLKLRVASIEEGGNITYIDDLKWDNGYYISDGIVLEEALLNDIDSYRGMLSTAYNIFQSNSSGQLAVIANLEVIETFSVSWNALLDDDSNILLYIFTNWTYSNDWIDSRSQVNPFAIDINGRKTQYKNGPYQLPLATLEESFILDESSDVFRLNDGSDPDFVIPVEGQFNKDSGEVSFKITPIMEFGKLGYLSQTLTINFANIGSGEATLTYWRYYNSDTSCTLNWGFQIYPKWNFPTESIKFDFYELTSGIIQDYCTESSWEQDIPKDRLGNLCHTFVVQDKPSFSGNFTEVIEFTDTFKKDNCYIVICEIKDSDGDIKLFHRLVYTSKQWNDKFLLNEVKDFDDLSLELNLKSTYNTNNLVTVNKDKSNIPSFASEVKQETGYITHLYKGTCSIEYCPKIEQSDLFEISSVEVSSGNTDNYNLQDIKVRMLNNLILDENHEELLEKPEVNGSVTLNNSTYSNNILSLSFTYEDETIIPYIVQFNLPDFIYPDYVLKNLKISPALYFRNYLRKSGLGCSTEISKSPLGGIIGEWDWAPGNKETTEINIEEAYPLYDAISNLLETYDIVPICYFIRKTNSNRSSKHNFVWLDPVNGNNIRDKSKLYLGDHVLLYCFYGNGEIFVKSYIHRNRYSFNADGVTVTSDTGINTCNRDNEDFNIYLPYMVNELTTSLEDKFANYLTLNPNSSSEAAIRVYKVSELNTYYTCKYLNLISVELSNIQVSLKKVVLNNSSLIPNLLLKDFNTTLTVQVSYTNVVDVDSYINNAESQRIEVCKLNSDGSYEQVSNIEFKDTTRLYDSLGNNVGSVTLPGGSGGRDYTTQPRVENGKLKLPNITAKLYDSRISNYYDDETLRIKVIGRYNG